MEIIYAPAFVRQLKKLEKDLLEVTLEKIEEFQDPKNHTRLKVHKLHGRLKNCYSFSVDHKNRIVFEYKHASKKEITLLATGDHDTYR